jgi:hypothetical protein
MYSATLDQVLDSVMHLPPEQRETLVDILMRREAEARRQEIAADAQRSLARFRAGEYRAQNADEVIAELRLIREQDE